MEPHIYTCKLKMIIFNSCSFSGAELSASQQGVYSCVIPDEFGVEQTLNFGLYDTDYAGKFLASISVSLPHMCMVLQYMTIPYLCSSSDNFYPAQDIP